MHALVIQGSDVGTQYRSGIYWHSEEQREAAEGALEYMQDHLGVSVTLHISTEHLLPRAL